MDEIAAIVADVAQDVFHRVPRVHVLDPRAAAGFGRNHHRVRVAEQIVQIAQDLLIGADQKDTHVIGLAVGRVQFEHFFHVFDVNEIPHAAVGVARDVGQDAARRGPLVQPVDGHDREEVVHGPRVGQALKQREIAEVRGRQVRFQTLEVFRHRRQSAHDLQDALADRSEKPLGDGPLR